LESLIYLIRSHPEKTFPDENEQLPASEKKRPMATSPPATGPQIPPVMARPGKNQMER